MIFFTYIDIPLIVIKLYGLRVIFYLPIVILAFGCQHLALFSECSLMPLMPNRPTEQAGRFPLSSFRPRSLWFWPKWWFNKTKKFKQFTKIHIELNKAQIQSENPNTHIEHVAHNISEFLRLFVLVTFIKRQRNSICRLMWGRLSIIGPTPTKGQIACCARGAGWIKLWLL